MQHFIYCWI